MISGIVRDNHALLPVTFRLLEQPDFSIEFVLDTGFSGDLTLPEAAVQAIGLERVVEEIAHLADGSLIVLVVHTGTIFWRNQLREVRVLATGSRPLLGTGLLEGSHLSVEFTENGAVIVEEL